MLIANPSLTMAPSAKQAALSLTVRRDGPAILFCIAVALLCQILVLRGRGPIVVLPNGDAGLVASFVAGWLHPDRFVNDLVLNDTAKFTFYVSIVLPYVALLNLVVHDIGTSYLLLYFPLVFFQLFGFYLLGRRLFGHPGWGLILAFIIFPLVWLWDGSEVWGTYYVPLTRMTFEAILPFLLLAFIRFAPDPRNLPLLMACCGFSIYAHPVDAPSVTAGLALASFAFVSRSTVLRFIKFLIIGSALFVLVAAPFAFLFFKGFPGMAPIHFSAAAEPAATAIFRSKIGPMYYDALLAFKEFVRGTINVHPLYIIGILTLILAPVFNPARRRICMFFLFFLAGILVASVGVCYLDQRINGFFGRTPAQIDLIRGLRFVVPTLLIGTVLFFNEMYRFFSDRLRFRRLAVIVPIVAALATVLRLHESPTWPAAAIGLSGPIPSAFTKVDEQAEAVLRFLRGQSQPSGVLPLTNQNFALAIRYGALQPVVYTSKDMNALLYSGSEDRYRWARIYELIEPFVAEKDVTIARKKLEKIISITKPHYVVIERDAALKTAAEALSGLGKVVIDDGKWILVDVSGPQPGFTER